MSTEALPAPLPPGWADRLSAILGPLIRRRWPLLATLVLIVIGMLASTWGATLAGRPDWGLPDDLWRTLAAAQRLLHLDIGGLYTAPTELISFPGAAVILIPVAAIADAAGLSLQLAGPQNPHPAVWLLAGPYEIAVASLALLAADALAEHLGATQLKRLLLAAAGAAALWGLTLRFGHPEDAVATGLFLFGILALAQSRVRRSGWLIGAAVAVQPLVLLALPFVLVTVEPRRLPGFLARAAIPGTLLLGIAAAANWSATVAAVTSQPNSPAVNRPTPWTSLIAHGSGGMVAAGPARALAILVACGCALLAGRRWGAAAQTGEWSTGRLTELLWWVAVVLALRCVFEPVMVAYYLWPALAVALIAASRSWPRLLAVSAASAALTFGAQAPWRDPWTWWLPVTAGLTLTLWLAYTPRTGDQLSPAPVMTGAAGGSR